MKIVTIAIPCYNEEENVEHTYKRLKSILKKIPSYSYRFLFTDNGSTDTTRKKIEALVKKDKYVQGVFFSRNFGIEASLTALMNYAVGDAVIVMLCDLQDPPEILIPQFIQKWEEGHNIVVAKYLNTQDDPFTTFLRKTFYFIFKQVSDLDIPVNASEVSLLDKKALDTMRALPEKFRFFRGLRVWVGFKVAFIPYRRQQRIYGSSSFNWISYFKYAERGIYGFSYLLLDMMMYGSLILIGVSFLSVLLYVGYHFFTHTNYSLFPTMLLAMFFATSVQLFGMGILGKYIQVMVEETKNRQVYVVDKIVGNIGVKHG